MEELREFYASRCSICGGNRVGDKHLQPLAAGDGFSSIIESIARQLYDQKLNTGSIPQALYEQTASQLMDAVFSGLGGKTFGYDDPNNKLITYLRQNLHSFSAAKSLTEMQAFNDLLTGPDGKMRTKAQFIAEVAKTGAEFNKTYLATEYDNALTSAQMAQKWDEFEDDDILQFSTVHDDKVRETHALLDGKTAPKTDPLWRRIWPPLDWKCRCTIIPGVKDKVRKHNVAELIKRAEIPKLFQNNSGITKTIVKDDHPYYHDSFHNEKELGAEANYGMPSVKKIYTDGGLPDAAKLKTKADANNWWKEKAGGNAKGHFDVVDKMGNTVRFDNEARNHILEDNTDGRHTILSNSEHIVTEPDEVWSIREGDKLTTTYIKYYDDMPYAVQVDGTRAYTMLKYEKNGKLNEASVNRDRRGVLLYRR